MPYILPIVKLISAGIGWLVTAQGITATIARFVVGAAISYGASRALAKKPNSSTFSDPGRSLMVRQPITTHRMVIGEMRVSGPITYITETGTDREYLHLIIVLAAHEIEAIDELWLNDEEVPLTSSGNDANGIARMVPSSGKFVDLVRAKFHLGGSGQVADADLVSEATLWTAAHKGEGRAYIYIRLKFDSDAYPTGIPNVSCVIRGLKAYDPRTATTIYTTNPAIVLRHYLTGSWLGATSAEVDDVFFQSEANICDELVNLNPTGTETRYKIAGVIDSSVNRTTAIQGIASTMAGSLIYANGKFRPRAGAYDTPVSTLNENDLRGDLRIIPRTSRRETFNSVRGVYIEPSQSYQPVDFPPVTNATYLSQDNGETIWRDLDLGLVTSSGQAQRIAKIELEKARQQITLEMPCKMTAYRIIPGSTVLIDNDRMGWTAKPFECIEWRLSAEPQGRGVALGVDLILRETASAVYDWALGEETVVDPEPDSGLPDPFYVSAPSALAVTSGASTVLTQADGTKTPRAKVTWNPPAYVHVTNGGAYDLEYRLTSGDDDDYTGGRVSGDRSFAYISGLQDATDYNFRIRAINNLGVKGAWVEITSQTIDADVTGPGVITSLVEEFTTWNSPTNHDIWFHWTNPSDSDFDHVLVTWRIGAGAIIGSIWTRGTSALVRGLSTTVSYNFEFTSYDRSGNAGGITLGYATTATSVVASQSEPQVFVQPVVLGDATNSYGKLITYGVTGYDSGPEGVFLGHDTDLDVKFRVGDPAGDFLKWDPTDGLSISGNIVGGSISIGSGDRLFEVDATSLRYGDRMVIYDTSAYLDVRMGSGHDTVNEWMWHVLDGVSGLLVRYVQNATGLPTMIRIASDGVGFGGLAAYDAPIRINDTTVSFGAGGPASSWDCSIWRLSAARLGMNTDLNIYGALTIGSAEDTNLYRSAANTLKTDDAFTVGTSLSVGTTLTTGGTATIGSSAGTGGGVIRISRNDTTYEGGEIQLDRASDGNVAWHIDAYTTALRIFRDSTNNNTSAAGIQIQCGAQASVLLYDGTTGFKSYGNGATDHYLVGYSNAHGMHLHGGGTAGNGAHIQLYGGSHATYANFAYYDADAHTFRTQNAGETIFVATSTGINLGTGNTYSIAGTQVVGPRGAAIADLSGGYDLTDVGTKINAILAMVRTHGLIST